MGASVRDIPAVNWVDGVPLPWTCQTDAPHECSGPVIGAVGAYPVCQAGAAAEIAVRDARDAETRAWMESPEGRRVIARESAAERRWERRVS
jgi:hypothetical protein